MRIKHAILEEEGHLCQYARHGESQVLTWPDRQDLTPCNCCCFSRGGWALHWLIQHQKNGWWIGLEGQDWISSPSKEAYAPNPLHAAQKKNSFLQNVWERRAWISEWNSPLGLAGCSFWGFIMQQHGVGDKPLICDLHSCSKVNQCLHLKKNGNKIKSIYPLNSHKGEMR